MKLTTDNQAPFLEDKFPPDSALKDLDATINTGLQLQPVGSPEIDTRASFTGAGLEDLRFALAYGHFIQTSQKDDAGPTSSILPGRKQSTGLPRTLWPQYSSPK